MLRLIGILTGSALAVAFLIIALGLPRFSPSDDGIGVGEAQPAAAVDAIVAPTGPETMVPEPAVGLDEPADEAVDGPGEPLMSDAETEALIDQIFAPQPQPQPAAMDAPTPDASDVDEKWYAFWSPFRSEIAANGFVARLQETTGIDYRVVKVKTGVYEVAFAYADDADIQDKLARISDATGLDMTGG